jgi:CubicO group peptidase (beta-lactamase class C family)
MFRFFICLFTNVLRFRLVLQKRNCRPFSANDGQMTGENSMYSSALAVKPVWFNHKFMKKILLYVLGTGLIMILWAGVVFLGTVNGWLHKPIAAQKTSHSFLTAVEKEIDKQFVGNFAMAIIKDGVVEYEKFQSVGKPVDRNTVFQVASLSKWISAFGIMKLVEDGKLDLDTPVSKYLTRWQLPPGEFNNEEVTVRRLLSHTAGLTDGLGYSGFEAGTRVQSLEQSLTQASDADRGIRGAVRVGIKPGSEFNYSGGGYTLLQLLVEEVSDQSFGFYMKQFVLEPLGMLHSTYVWDESSAYPLAEFYNSDSTKAKHYRYTSLAATSLYTSLADLELFFQAHREGNNNEPIGRNILKPETVKMMRKPHAQEMGIDIWGLGTVLYAPADGHDFIIGHDGKSNPPINTAVRLNPETGDGIIILETGNPIVATKLASEWVFWKTGKVDLFLFPMLIKGMVWTIGIGWVVIIVIAIVLSMVGKASTERSLNYFSEV